MGGFDEDAEAKYFSEREGTESPCSPKSEMYDGGVDWMSDGELSPRSPRKVAFLNYDGSSVEPGEAKGDFNFSGQASSKAVQRFAKMISERKSARAQVMEVEIKKEETMTKIEALRLRKAQAEKEVSSEVASILDTKASRGDRRLADTKVAKNKMTMLEHKQAIAEKRRDMTEENLRDLLALRQVAS